MKLVVCRMCTDDEPFAVPLKFRRTYMKLHFEKAHGITVDSLKFSRKKGTPGNSDAVWYADLDGRQAGLMLETEVSVPELSATVPAGGLATPFSGTAGPTHRKVETGHWSAAMMQDLYRDRVSSNSLA